MIYAGSHSPEHLVDLWISSSKIYQEKKFMGRPSVHTFSTRGEFRQEKKCRGKKKEKKEKEAREWFSLGSHWFFSYGVETLWGGKVLGPR